LVYVSVVVCIDISVHKLVLSKVQSW